MHIRQIIRETILREGPVSFERFMDLALYHPEKGYYNSSRNPIGPHGDYYTMPYLTPVFGAMIARQDITAQVNFSALSYFGKIAGLEVAGYVSQANFLRSLGLLSFLSDYENLGGPEYRSGARFVADLLLIRPGNTFKVLIQYKGLAFPQLTGLMLRNPARL